MKKESGICALLILLSFFWGCQKNGTEGNQNESQQTLACIDDSLEAMSPGAKIMAERFIASAPDSTTYYEGYARLARFYYFSASDSFLPMLNRAERFARNQPSSERLNTLLAYIYNCQGVYYHNHHRSPNEVISLYRHAYDCLRQSNAKEQMPKVCANLGDAYMFVNRLSEAASWYRRALFLVDSLSLPQKENVTIYMGLASIYQQLNDFDTALKYYRQTEQHFQDMSPGMQAYFLNNYGNYYYYVKDYKTSLKKFLALKAFLESQGRTSTFDMYICKLNLADIYLNTGELDLSERYLDEVEPLIKVQGDATAIYYMNTIRIGLAVKQKNAKAVADILASEHDTGVIEFPMRQIRNRYIRQYAEHEGNFRMAYRNLVDDIRQDDSLEHNRSNMRASEIMERFRQDTLQLHHQLVLEKKNADILEANNRALMAIGGMLIIAFSFILWTMRNRRKREKDKISIMRWRLNSARNRISPHFVFNLLNSKMLKTDEHEADELMELSQLIRANLDLTCRQAVTLREELDFVSKYVELERSTLDDKLDFTVTVNPQVDIDSVQIPSMFVQILVENCFAHGLRGWKGEKRITIHADHDSDATHIRVCDNGQGFDIRSMGKKRTGLTIISQTLAVVNERNKRRHMAFSVHNKTKDGKTIGCEATIVVPDGIELDF
jgi:tetratricopeptide (TPR) repeat protein